jgi:hypothetical protein
VTPRPTATSTAADRRRSKTPAPGSRPPAPRPATPFLITREHRRFAEFADAVRANRYIGACYGPPGIGKTLSARTYAAADDWEAWQTRRHLTDTSLPDSLLTSRAVLWTPHVTTTPRELDLKVPVLCEMFSQAIQSRLHPDYDPELSFGADPGCPHTELLIVDEADRLRATGLEQLRDYFDRYQPGLILIGMPGLKRRLARYPQLYSRIGFAHQYRPLADPDLAAVLAAYWTRLGHTLHPDSPTDADAIAAIGRITGGNFRLIERLLGQVRRVLDINNLDTITADVVDAARGALVIGT